MHQIDAFNLKNVRNILLAEWALDRPQWSEVLTPLSHEILWETNNSD